MLNLKKYESLIIAFFATIVRYYDYALFGLSASLMSKNFMPGATEGDQLLIFFAVYGVAAMARPVGSLIFGKIGDHIGRVVSVKIATVIAAASSCLVAIAPSFNNIGFFAVIVITLLRMLFLMSLAGEVDAIKIYVAEMVGKRRRHLVTGIISFSSQIGVLTASVAYHIAISYEEIEWLWRLNFAIGGFFSFVVVLLQARLLESGEFIESKSKTTHETNVTIGKIIGANKVKFTLAIIINGMLGGGYNFLIIFFSTFVAAANLVGQERATADTIALVSVYATACLISGYMSDRFKAISQVIGALILSIFCTILMEFTLVANDYLVSLHLILVFLFPFYSIPCAILIQSLFHTGIRMRVCSLSHSIGSMIFSATTPFVCIFIWETTDAAYLVLTYFLLQLGILLFALLYMIKNGYTNTLETIL